MEASEYVLHFLFQEKRMKKRGEQLHSTWAASGNDKSGPSRLSPLCSAQQAPHLLPFRTMSPFIYTLDIPDGANKPFFKKKKSPSTLLITECSFDESACLFIVTLISYFKKKLNLKCVSQCCVKIPMKTLMIYCRRALWMPALNYHCKICTFIQYKEILQPHCYRCRMYWDTDAFLLGLPTTELPLIQTVIDIVVCVVLSLQRCYNFLWSITVNDD